MAVVAGTTAYPDFIPKLDSKNSGLVGNIQAKLYTPSSPLHLLSADP